jgi:L-malate glycosyltransferase
VPDPRVTVCQVLLTLGVGGAEVLAARIARRLSGRFRFVFLCLNEPGALGPGLHGDGFAVHSLRKRPGIDGRAVGRLATTLRRERVDVVHAHQYAPFFYSPGERQNVVWGGEHRVTVGQGGEHSDADDGR